MLTSPDWAQGLICMHISSRCRPCQDWTGVVLPVLAVFIMVVSAGIYFAPSKVRLRAQSAFLVAFQMLASWTHVLKKGWDVGASSSRPRSHRNDATKLKLYRSMYTSSYMHILQNIYIYTHLSTKLLYAQTHPANRNVCYKIDFQETILFLKNHGLKE